MYIKTIFTIVFFIAHIASIFSQVSVRDSLVSIIQKHREGAILLHDSMLVNRYNDLARTFFPSQPDSLRFYATKALSLSESADYLKGKAHAYRLIGIAYYAVGENTLAIENYRISAEISREIGDLTNLASNYNNIAVIYDIWGDNETSLNYYMRSLEINRERDFERGIAYNLINIGLIYHNLGRILQALDTQMEALAYVERMNDLNGQALIFHNLGSIYSDLEKHDESLQKFRRTIVLRQQIDDLAGLGSTFHNMGIVMLAKNEVDSARYYFQRAIDATERSNNLRMMPGILISMGELAMDDKDYPSAMDYFTRAHQISVKMNDQYRIGHSLKKQAMVWHSQGNFREALAKAQEAMNIALTIENKKLQMYVSRSLSIIYESRGEITRAFEYFKGYTSIADSLNNFEIQRRSARLDAEYEYMKKETELLLRKTEMELANRNRLNRQIFFTVLAVLFALFLGVILVLNHKNKMRIQVAYEDLVARNLEIAAQKDQLERLAKELEEAGKTKNRIFSVISHDLRGPLSYAVMAVDMALKKDEEFIRKSLPLIKTNLDNVYALTDSLLEWAKVQMKKEALSIEDIDISAILSGVAMGLDAQLSKKKILLESGVPRKTMIKGEKNILELVIRNILGNAIKFSNLESNIRITVETKEQRTIVSIADQGVGIPESDMQKLYGERTITRTGTADEKGSGMGLKLSKEFLAKINGELWLESEAGKGTTVYISLHSATS